MHLTHNGRLTRICVCEHLRSSNIGVLPYRHQAFIWTNAVIGILDNKSQWNLQWRLFMYKMHALGNLRLRELRKMGGALSKAKVMNTSCVIIIAINCLFIT